MLYLSGFIPIFDLDFLWDCLFGDWRNHFWTLIFFCPKKELFLTLSTALPLLVMCVF
jgi:hypothetical protein